MLNNKSKVKSYLIFWVFPIILVSLNLLTCLVAPFLELASQEAEKDPDLPLSDNSNSALHEATLLYQKPSEYSQSELLSCQCQHCKNRLWEFHSFVFFFFFKFCGGGGVFGADKMRLRIALNWALMCSSLSLWSVSSLSCTSSLRLWASYSL